ncbi:hypothetical protein CH063_11656, partial [Colletotrichum higginsianum]
MTLLHCIRSAAWPRFAVPSDADQPDMSAQNQLHRHPTACVVYTELKTVYKNPYHGETIFKHAYHQCVRGCGFCLRGNSTRCSASAYLARTPNAPTTGFALLVEQPEPGLGCFNRRSMQHIETPIAFTAVSSCARKRGWYTYNHVYVLRARLRWARRRRGPARRLSSLYCRHVAVAEC